MIINEKERVLECSQNAQYAAGVQFQVTQYCGEIFKRYMCQGSVLEMGPAEGAMTDILYPFFKEDYTIVDGADFFVEAIKRRYPMIQGHSKLFEEYVPSRTFNNIILGHVLEHVENPIDILKKCGSWLSPGGGGVILAAVPNSHSVHRQAAVYMGLLETENQLNETDFRNGHRRVYDMASFKQNFIDAGLTIVQSGGYWFKPESNAQINTNWDEKMIKAFLRLGEDYPEIAGEIYIVGTQM